MFIMKVGRRKTAEEIAQANQKRVRIIGENEKYKYFGILEEDKWIWTKK